MPLPIRPTPAHRAEPKGRVSEKWIRFSARAMRCSGVNRVLFQAADEQVVIENIRQRVPVRES